MENLLPPSAESVGHNFTLLLRNDPGDALYRVQSTFSVVFTSLNPTTPPCGVHSSLLSFPMISTRNSEPKLLAATWLVLKWFSASALERGYGPGICMFSEDPSCF